jgi:hypothetical protein
MQQNHTGVQTIAQTKEEVVTARKQNLPITTRVVAIAQNKGSLG